MESSLAGELITLRFRSRWVYFACCLESIVTRLLGRLWGWYEAKRKMEKMARKVVDIETIGKDEVGVEITPAAEEKEEKPMEHAITLKVEEMDDARLSVASTANLRKSSSLKAESIDDKASFAPSIKKTFVAADNMIFKFDDDRSLSLFHEVIPRSTSKKSSLLVFQSKRSEMDYQSKRSGIEYQTTPPPLQALTPIEESAISLLPATSHAPTASGCTLEIPRSADPAAPAAASNASLDPTLNDDDLPQLAPVESFVPMSPLVYRGTLNLVRITGAWTAKGIAFVIMLFMTSLPPATNYSWYFNSVAPVELSFRVLVMVPVWLLAEWAMLEIEARLMGVEIAESIKWFVEVSPFNFSTYIYHR
ncbi:hypothetical protein HK101_009577 [Irineochytrium annulatum]|nr:hypothetical protein HK101_009577 [Irineochytrium annulatum]